MAETKATRRRLGLADLECRRAYYIEFVETPNPAQLEALCRNLAQGQLELVDVDQFLRPGEVQIIHKLSVVDNESDSIVTFCELLSIKASAGKVATIYSSASERLGELVAERIFNGNTDDLHTVEPSLASLAPVGVGEPIQTFDLSKCMDEQLAAIGTGGGRNLSVENMRRIRNIQNAMDAPAISDVLLEALDARWSDHCAHTTWRSRGNLLNRLRMASADTSNPNIVSMFGDNAGVWDFYDGWALAIKAETHNGPSAISAYFGQLTKLGGVLRDILGTGLGADPVGCFEYTATGLPEEPPAVPGLPDARHIAIDTIRAIKEYGNTFGVPMMSSRMTFHPSYRAKPFALGGSIGVIPKQLATKGIPQPGDLVMLIGGLTGNDGIHGASSSSVGAEMSATAVQIGAPLEQVVFRGAILDLRDAGCLRALTDVGGAGLNSAVGEIGEACGVDIDTALVPLKTSALSCWRILLSESQERMILCVKPDNRDTAERILARHQVRATVIGKFTDSGAYVVRHGSEVAFDVPYHLIDIETDPVEVAPLPVPTDAAQAWPQFDPDAVANLFAAVLQDGEVASQAYANEQYDSTVRGNTIYGPQFGPAIRVNTGYWAARPVEGSAGVVIVSTAFDPWLYESHPVRALRQLFSSLLVGQVLAGSQLRDVCLCDNFYTPHRAPHWDSWLVAMVDEMAALIRHFGTPVISGKDSSAGSSTTPTGLVHVPPAVFLTALGKVPGIEHLLTEQWTQPGNVLVRIGLPTARLTATVAGRTLGLHGGIPDDIDISQVAAFLTELAQCRHMFRSGSMIKAGGLAALLATGTIGSGLGVDLQDRFGHSEALFTEDRCCAVVEVPPSLVDVLPAALKPTVIGTLDERGGVRVAGTELLTREALELWSTAFEKRIA
ncbi:MAG TPA: AIR synthase-related protein [Candidatus Limnocylindrales bacterium]|nr:AIR synthase-related protein [Candidatus Limnocylindrales bacterium]